MSSRVANEAARVIGLGESAATLSPRGGFLFTLFSPCASSRVGSAPCPLFARVIVAPVTKAAPSPGGGPDPAPANERANANSAYSTSPEDEQLPVITIYSTGNILRGKTGSFVLKMNPPLMFGGTYVNFKVSGTAIPGVDYVALISPAYIGQSGYGVISVATLPDPRASSFRQAYSVVVTLEPGLGYAVGIPSSATMWIKP